MLSNYLRDYQKDLIEKIVESFKSGHNRPLVVLPCGGGKTVIFAFMAAMSQAKGKTVWFAVHRKELLDQTLKTFEKFNIPLESIYIDMISTFGTRGDKFPKPDFIIFDECSHSTAKTWQKVIDNNPEAKIVGLTATPCRLDGKPLGTVYDDIIIGKSVLELTKMGYLAEYDYYSVGRFDPDIIKKSKGDLDQQQVEKIFTETKIFGDVISNYRQFANGLQTICYSPTVAYSEQMAQIFNDNGIKAVHFDGKTSKKERDNIVQDFRDKKIQVLCNCDLISEGFDVPDCHCCILLRPTLSTSLFIQQASRALRPQEGKRAVIIDMVRNYERHGMPNEDREWSLHKPLKIREKYDSEGNLSLRQCSFCFHTFKTAPVCPMCGKEYIPTKKEIENFQEIELEKIEERKKAHAEEKVSKFSHFSQCRSKDELIAFAKKNGYNNGWVWYQMKSRGWLK